MLYGMKSSEFDAETPVEKDNFSRRLRASAFLEGSAARPTSMTRSVAGNIDIYGLYTIILVVNLRVKMSDEDSFYWSTLVSNLAIRLA